MQPRAIIASVLFASLSGLIFSIHAAESGALQFVRPDLQLGALTNGQVVSITFELTNRSDEAVKIANVDTSCHCTSVQKSPDEIPAHGSGVVELNFNSSRSDGPVTQSVVMETAGGQILTAQFSATVGSGGHRAVDSRSRRRHLSESRAVRRLFRSGRRPRRR